LGTKLSLLKQVVRRAVRLNIAAGLALSYAEDRLVQSQLFDHGLAPVSLADCAGPVLGDRLAESPLGATWVAL
jgi:hypothetical protein